MNGYHRARKNLNYGKCFTWCDSSRLLRDACTWLLCLPLSGFDLTCQSCPEAWKTSQFGHEQIRGGWGPSPDMRCYTAQMDGLVTQSPETFIYTQCASSRSSYAYCWFFHRIISADETELETIMY